MMCVFVFNKLLLVCGIQRYKIYQKKLHNLIQSERLPATTRRIQLNNNPQYYIVLLKDGIRPRMKTVPV